MDTRDILTPVTAGMQRSAADFKRSTVHFVDSGVVFNDNHGSNDVHFSTTEIPALIESLEEGMQTPEGVEGAFQAAVAGKGDARTWALEAVRDGWAWERIVRKAPEQFPDTDENDVVDAVVSALDSIRKDWEEGSDTSPSEKDIEKAKSKLAQGSFQATAAEGDMDGELIKVRFLQGGRKAVVKINGLLVYQSGEDDPDMVQADVSVFLTTLGEDLARGGY